jgi:penicillin-binding protein 1A
VILPQKWKPCVGCNAKDWNGRAMPRFTAAGKQVMDPITAYQVVHMLEGVVQRGTATVLRDLDRPLFGKTGTTTGPTNVWFVGGTPHLISGVYLGYDQPRNMGGYAQGGALAAPIFKQFAKVALADEPRIPFVAPYGVRMVRIDRSSGKRVFGAWPGDDPKSAVIWEAFKAETAPKRSVRQEELAARLASVLKQRKAAVTKTAATPKSEQQPTAKADPVQGASGTKRDQDFTQEQGGIY